MNFKMDLNGNLSLNELISWIMLIVVSWSLSFLWLPLAFATTIYGLWFIRSQFYDVKWIDPRGKVVYITGCDSGFGKAAALALANAGFTVCAGCLKPEQCGNWAYTPNIHVLDLDVSDQDKVNKCAQLVKNICGEKGLWALYNNAGFATAGEIEWVPLELYQRQMDVNLWGSVRVTKSVLPLIRQAEGRVVSVTSGISRSAASGRSPYCMSKAALESFMECLRYEMDKFGVKCIVIQPGNLSGSTNVFAGLADQVEKICRNMPPETKKAYGQDYLEHFINSTVKNYSSREGTGSIDPVVNSIKHAIMSERPRLRYKPAQMGWILWFLFHDLLPEEITHQYMTKWVLSKLPRPAGRKIRI